MRFSGFGRVAVFATLLMFASLLPAGNSRLEGAAGYMHGRLGIPPAFAASCCGGGGAASLVIPKFAKSGLDASLDFERYDGYWDAGGKYHLDPPGSDLAQYRLNLGYARRFGENIQGSITAPLIFNSTRYAATSSQSAGLGDMQLGFLYEWFDTVMCVYNVESWDDLKPAVYTGITATIPAGISPYDNVESSFNITGRGFYRLDANISVEKTVYPWTVSLQASYGKYLNRPVNREYGEYVRPYHKQPGDRSALTVSGGYTWFMKSMATITPTVSYTDLREGRGSVDGGADPASGFTKRSVSLSVGWSDIDMILSVRAGYLHTFRQNGWGSNFPATDIYSIGVKYVFWE